MRKKTSDKKEVKEEDLNSLIEGNVTFLAAIGERLETILYVFANSDNDSGKTGLTYDTLSELWDVIVVEALLPAERDVIYKWIKETAESKAGFPMSIDDLLKFFQEKMNSSQDYKNMTVEGFSCFKNLFLIINEKLTKISKVVTSNVTAYTSSYNGYGPMYSSYSYNYEESKAVQADFEYRVNVLPEELEGISSLWNFILVTDNESVGEKAIDFLNKLYLHVDDELKEKIIYIRSEYLSACFKNLKEVLDNKEQLGEKVFASKCLKCISLIRSMMDESEKKGIGNLKSHSGLVKGELLGFTVNNDLTYGSDVPKKVEIKLHSNTTVYELRVEVGKQLKVTWDQVKLMRNAASKEIKDNENGKTLGDIRIRNGEVVTASKRPTPPVKQENLILADGSMNPAAKKIFVEWYEIHSENGKMNADQCAAFIHSCTNDNCKGDDKRVKDVFATYDDDRDGFLTIDNFLEFYTIACKQRPSVVWSNLAAQHYRNDLKKASEVEEEKIDTTVLTRYIISRQQEYFHEIFSLLDCGGVVATEAWKLLNRLPTSPEIFSDILLLTGVKETSEKAWDHILDSNSTYRLLYALHVIEYLMEGDDADDENEEEGDALIKEAKLLECKKTWKTDFIIYGGFDHLFKIFNKFSRKNPGSLSLFDKNIVSFILKILKNYLAATFSSSTPYIYRSLSFIRIYTNLDFIQNYITTEQKEQEKAKQLAATAEGSSSGQPLETPNQKREGSEAVEPTTTVALAKKESKLDDKKKEKLKIEETEEFRILVQRLKGDLGGQIISKLNLRDLIQTISLLGHDILQKEQELESEDRMILEYSLSILIAVLLYDNSTLNYFLDLDNKPDNFKEGDGYLIKGIFCSKSINVRRYFAHAIYVLCRYTAGYSGAAASKHIINLFLNNLPSIEDDTKKDCNQYFELLCKLIEETYAVKEGTQVTPGDFDFQDLLGKIIHRLKEHVSTEKRQNLYYTDKILTGLLNLCDKILIVDTKLRDSVGAVDNYDLVREVFNVCLFYVHEKEDQFNDIVGDTDVNVFAKDYVKCKSRDARSIAYKLLITLCKGHSANLLILLDSIKELMVAIFKSRTNQAWNYSPSSDTRSFHGYVGIKNLGCICYMNAMLQQFFMTPTFRYAVLAADDKKEPNLVAKENKFIADDNVLHQLQQMFGSLELSDRRDYNPQEFCFAFKDFSGQPINVSEQQDAQEFLNTLFDRLENGLKQTPFKHILEGVYGGKTSNQIICHGCRNVREKEEIFYNMSVEVRNMKTVYDSFEQFITGETIDDYFCDSCQQKNSITKRTCLSYLPNVLIVHLKRIVFDLDTLMNQKINSRLEFPFEMDMEPFTAEGLAWREKSKEQGAKTKTSKKKDQGKDLDKNAEGEVDEEENNQEAEEDAEKPGPYKQHPKEYYQYKLVGVVVHIGTAEVGHYYSYINVNRGDNKAGANDKWHEFNDSTIKDFDVKTMEKECFGGNSSDASDDTWGLGKAGRETSKSAYMLVYERVVKDPLRLVVKDKEDEAFLDKLLNVDRSLRENPNSIKVVNEEVEGAKEGENKLTSYYCDYFMLKRFVPSKVYKVSLALYTGVVNL